MKTEQINFDLIGDVHGHFETLLQMISLLGYKKNQTSYFHPQGRKILFVGDLINRGPDSVGVLKLVKELHQTGVAELCLGNHEFRLLQQAHKNPSEVTEEFLPFLSWLRTIPFFLEKENFRVVHAAWHYSSVQLLRGKSAGDDSFISKTLQKGSLEQHAVDRILSGIQVSLPKNPVLFDRFSIPRKKARVKWWKDLENKSFADSLYSPMRPEINDQFPNPEEIAILEPYCEEDPTVFLGHYSLTSKIPKIIDQIVCLDGCVSCDKILWGYRHHGEAKPMEKNLISCSSG